MGHRLHQDGLLWIAKYTDNVIKELHMRLEAPHLGVDETNTLRGEILRLRILLDDAKQAFEAGTMI